MDYYAQLGVAKNATSDEIKRAYRKLASANHPDRGGSTSLFQSIQQAYDTLGDEKKRRTYDSTLLDIRSANRSSKTPFGNRVYTVNVSVTLEQVARGERINIQVNAPYGMQYFQIRIPMGTETAQRHTFDGLMQDGLLQVLFIIRDHAKFTRKNLDIEETKSVNVLKLITGTKITTKDIWGTEFEIAIPKLTKIGSKFRIVGRGMKTDSGKVGDHYVLINATMPDKISDELFSILEKE